MARRKKRKFNYLFWTPRVLAILFTLALIILAAQIFMQGFTENNLIGFAIFLTPAYVLVAALIYAWNNEIWGGWVFIGLSIFYLFFTYQIFNFTNISLLSGVNLLIGMLFLLDHHHRKV